MLIETSYQSQFPINNGHIETIVPYFLRQVDNVIYERERIETPDHDFLDLDWKKQNGQRLVILSHGLEGCSQSNYILGVVQSLSQNQYDVLAWNNRGCSGETNRLLKMYHSGASYDLRTVIDHVLATTTYNEIFLVGFSMGGNITLKYLGEQKEDLDSRIKKAMAISVPISLSDCALSLSKGFAKIYSKNFIVRIVKKLRIKEKQFPDFNPDLKSLNRMWDFEAFDDAVTAPINGFKNAREYWEKSSSLHFLPDIRLKTLVVNALNDPFLAGRCYPYEVLKDHPFVDFETPLRGGHVGFVASGLNDIWIEKRIQEFLES